MPPGCCLNRTFFQPLTVDELTHASSVMPFVRSSDDESAMLTSDEVPLNCSAPPYLPDFDHVPFCTVPSFLLPDESATFAPAPSSNEYSAPRPLAAAFEFGAAAAATSRTSSASAVSAYVRTA